VPRDVARDLVAWQHAHLRDGRIVPPDHLHLTLAFLGARPTGELEAITGEVRAAGAAVDQPIVLEPVRYRETRSVGMLVLSDEERRATRLAADLHARLERLGVYTPEKRPWLPHVTVLRFRRPPRFRPSVPPLGQFTPSGAAVYHSLLRPTGAQYEILERVALGG